MGKCLLPILVAVFVLSSSSVAKENDWPCLYDAECPNKECCLFRIDDVVRDLKQFPPKCGSCEGSEHCKGWTACEGKMKHGTRAKPKPGANNLGNFCRNDKDCDNTTLCCEFNGKPTDEYRRIGTCDDCSLISGYGKGLQCLYDTDCPDQKCCLYLTKYESRGQESVCGNCNVENRKYGTKVKPKVKTMVGQLCRKDQDCQDEKLWCFDRGYAVKAGELKGICQDNTWKEKLSKSQNTDICLFDQDCKNPAECCIWKNGLGYTQTFCHNCVGMNKVRVPKREPLNSESDCRKDADCKQDKADPKCCLLYREYTMYSPITNLRIGECKSCSVNRFTTEAPKGKDKAADKGKTMDKGKPKKKA